MLVEKKNVVRSLVVLSVSINMLILVCWGINIYKYNSPKESSKMVRNRQMKEVLEKELRLIKHEERKGFPNSYEVPELKMMLFEDLWKSGFLEQAINNGIKLQFEAAAETIEDKLSSKNRDMKMHVTFVFPDKIKTGETLVIQVLDPSVGN